MTIHKQFKNLQLRYVISGLFVSHKQDINFNERTTSVSVTDTLTQHFSVI